MAAGAAMGDSIAGGRPLALDLAALVAEGADASPSRLDWPTPYEAYGFITTELVDDLATAARAAAIAPQLEAVIEAKLGDAVIDLAVIARLVVDLAHVRGAGRCPLYSRDHSPWLHFLDRGGADARGLGGYRAWHYQRPQGAIPALKRRLRRWHSDARAALSPAAGRYDVLSRNRLVDAYFACHGARSIDISPNYRDWPAPAEIPATVCDAVAAMSDAFAPLAKRAAGGDAALAAAAQALARPVIGAHFGKAWADLERIRRLVTERRAGAVLAGGTPKHIGRLFAWQYRQLGRRVLRFAHGGERAFYDDYAWGLTELPFCDTYVCHSRAEADLVERRRAEGRMAAAGPGGIAFVGPGCRNRRAVSAPRRPRNGTVMYVAGGYLGEALAEFPSRKPPDPLYLEWQVWLLQAIRCLGFRTITKVHPKGVFNKAMLLRPFCDELVGGYFDPEGHEVDCYVFDFAGTAFFDALATDRGVVLIDMGIRPRDANSFNDLRARCEVIECTLGPGNRFRLDTSLLGEAIERAATAREWPETFFETYFHG